MWTQDHILFSLFLRCSGEMENFALSSFGFGRSVCLLPPVFHCSIHTSPTLYFVHLRALKKLVERIASMGRGRAGAAQLISRRFSSNRIEDAWHVFENGQGEVLMMIIIYVALIERTGESCRSCFWLCLWLLGSLWCRTEFRYVCFHHPPH